MPNRVLLADDHASMRDGMRLVLESAGGITVAGAAADGREAIREAARLAPDVVVMDIAMPGLGGLEATMEIKKGNPEIKILVLSQYDDKEYVSRLIKAGVSGYILKHAVGTDLITAIRAVARGESYLYPAIAATLIDDYLKVRRRRSLGLSKRGKLIGQAVVAVVFVLLAERADLVGELRNKLVSNREREFVLARFREDR